METGCRGGERRLRGGRSLQGRGLGWRLQDQKMLRHQNQEVVGFRDARAGLGQRELEKQRRCMITTARGSAGREGFWMGDEQDEKGSGEVAMGTGGAHRERAQASKGSKRGRALSPLKQSRTRASTCLCIGLNVSSGSHSPPPPPQLHSPCSAPPYLGDPSS